MGLEVGGGFAFQIFICEYKLIPTLKQFIRLNTTNSFTLPVLM